jgi:hypothetical protein
MVMAVDLSGIAAPTSAAQLGAVGTGGLPGLGAAALPTAIMLASTRAQRIDFTFMASPFRVRFVAMKLWKII